MVVGGLVGAAVVGVGEGVVEDGFKLGLKPVDSPPSGILQHTSKGWSHRFSPNLKCKILDKLITKSDLFQI